jgi:SWIM zinc finger
MSVAQQTRPTRDAWEARALELAAAQHLTGTARLLAENELRAFYGVRRSGPVGEYTVRVDRIAGELRRPPSCGCMAGEHGKPCKHAGAVLHALGQRERAISQADIDPLASWRRGLDW